MPGPAVDPDNPARLSSAHPLRHKIKICLALSEQLPRPLRRPILTDFEQHNP
jgi:hypothetical protein